MINLFKKLKYTYQRSTRGFSDHDMYNADMYMAGLIAGMLRYYVDNSNVFFSVPCCYAKEDDYYCTDHDHMIATRNEQYTKYALMFEEYHKHGCALGEAWKKEFGGLTEDEVHDMMTWFAKHFTEFWE